MAAPALLPLAELLPRTTRWGLPAVSAQELSLPPSRLLGAALFDGGGSPELQTYLGATVILLVVVGALASMSRGRFWTITLMTSFILALGAFTPLYGWVMRVIPGMSSLRVPARFYLIVGLAAAMLAGYAYDRLREAGSDKRAMRRVRLAAVGMAAMLLALPILDLALRIRRGGMPGGAASWSSLAGGILACGTAGLVFVMLRAGSRVRLAGAALVALVALDLGVANAFTLRVEPAGKALSRSTCELAGGPFKYGDHRIFSPSYSIPQQLAPLCSMEIADGVNPLQLTSYRNAMASATGFSAEAYGVTLPPFPDGDVQLSWHPVIDANALGLLNIDRVVSAYPIEARALELARESDGAWVYRNLEARPRAWIEPGASDAAGWRPVSAFEWTPNWIRIRANGPGRLVLSEIAYPGWTARVDGSSAAVETHAGILRSVSLPPGDHEVVFRFVPASFIGGGALGLAAALALLALRRRR